MIYTQEGLRTVLGALSTQTGLHISCNSGGRVGQDPFQSPVHGVGITYFSQALFSVLHPFHVSGFCPSPKAQPFLF